MTNNFDWVSRYRCKKCKKTSNRNVLLTNPIGARLIEPGTEGAPTYVTACCRATIELIPES